MGLGWKRTIAGGVLALGLVGTACSNYGGASNVTGASAAPQSPAPATSGAPASSAPPATTAATTGSSVNCTKAEGVVALTTQGFAFQPAKLSAKSCTTVKITNKDQANHTFTIDGSTVNSAIPPGGNTSATLELAPGTYTFYCRFHGSPDGTGMAGKLTVT